MNKLYEYELQKASDILVRDLLQVKNNETVVITLDTETNDEVAESAARSSFSFGAKPMLIKIPSPIGVSKGADSMLPIKSLSEVLKNADVWIEFNKKWLLYSTPYEEAMNYNKKLRHICLTGTTVNTMVNCIGKVNYKNLKKFSDKLVNLLKDSNKVRMTSNQGMDIEFINSKKNPIISETGYANKPGTHMIAGQIAWTPKLDSVNGTIVLDGSIAPNIGLIKNLVYIKIEKGKIRKIYGGIEATEYNKWLRSFDNEQMLTLAHTGIGFNIGAKLSGDILEDQRVWGSTTWGFGSISRGLMPPDGKKAPSHSDTVSLNTTIYLDDKIVMKEGEIVDEKININQKELMV